MIMDLAKNAGRFRQIPEWPNACTYCSGRGSVSGPPPIRGPHASSLVGRARESGEFFPGPDKADLETLLTWL
jgi:hypothetical protein